jgi:hypothetical protein
MASSLHDLAAARFQAMRQQQASEPKKETETKDSNSIELPEAITKLNTGSDYWVQAKANRYKKLIREGHLHDLLELATLAHHMATKADPSHWFAKVCSVKAWERTLHFLKKLYAARHKAEQVAQRIGSSVNKFIFKQIWAQRSVERHAATAQELRHDKPNQSSAKLFAWLCQQEGRQMAA